MKHRDVVHLIDAQHATATSQASSSAVLENRLKMEVGKQPRAWDWRNYVCLEQGKGILPRKKVEFCWQIRLFAFCAADHILWQLEIHHLPEIHSKEEALQWPSTVTSWFCKPIVFPTVSKDSMYTPSPTPHVQVRLHDYYGIWGQASSKWLRRLVHTDNGER